MTNFEPTLKLIKFKINILSGLTSVEWFQCSVSLFSEFDFQYRTRQSLVRYWNYSFIVNEHVQITPDNTLTGCLKLWIINYIYTRELWRTGKVRYKNERVPDRSNIVLTSLIVLVFFFPFLWKFRHLLDNSKVVAPWLWNQLPLELWSVTSVYQSKMQLKTLI